MRSAHSMTALILLAALAAAPAARAQEMMAEESPDPGFRVLAPRTVVSFVRQSLPGPAPAEMPQPEPRFNTLVHVSNTGSGMLGGVAIFVNSRGDERRAMRFSLAPGQTGSFPVSAIIGDRLDGLAPLATGIVLLRFFVPVDDDEGRFYSQMVSAEMIQEMPDLPPQVLRLDVERPQELYPRMRSRR